LQLNFPGLKCSLYTQETRKKNLIDSFWSTELKGLAICSSTQNLQRSLDFHNFSIIRKTRQFFLTTIEAQVNFLAIEFEVQQKKNLKIFAHTEKHFQSMRKPREFDRKCFVGFLCFINIFGDQNEHQSLPSIQSGKIRKSDLLEKIKN
jgi:hypothetical protein